MFVVGEHFHCLPEVVGRYRLEWLLTTYKRVLKSRWDAQVQAIQGAELAMGRAMAQVFGSKTLKLPDLPTFEEMLRQRLPAEVRLPEWMAKFEAVNRPQTE